MKINAVVFTYEGDRELAVIAAAALLTLGCDVTLAWDRNAPQWALEQAPLAKHVVTTFPRGRNLTGPECVTGILDMYDSVAHGADWVMKVDSDTIVRRAFIQRLELSTHDAEGAIVGCSDDRDWYGACYAIRPKCLPKLRTTLNAGMLYPKCPEDLTIFQGLGAAGFDANRPVALEWVYHTAKGEMIVRPAHSEVCHYGDMRNIPAPHHTVLQRKRYLAALMAKDETFNPQPK